MNCAAPRWPYTSPNTRPRNIRLERELTAMAAEAVDFLDDCGLSDFADHRALPGGVRLALDWRREAMEELADCRNYIVWGIEGHWEGYLDGDPDASKQVALGLTALSSVVRAWDALRP